MAEAKGRTDAGGTDSGEDKAADGKPMLLVELERRAKPLAAKYAKQHAFREKTLARREGTDQTTITAAEVREQAKNDFSADERLLVQAIEYGTFVADGDLMIGTARAFNDGDPVPISTVEAKGWHEMDPPLVRRVDGKG